jgi:hypothetical protein
MATQVRAGCARLIPTQSPRPASGASRGWALARGSEQRRNHHSHGSAGDCVASRHAAPAPDTPARPHEERRQFASLCCGCAVSLPRRSRRASASPSPPPHIHRVYSTSPPPSVAVAGWVASYVVKRIKAFNPTAERPFVLGELAQGWGKDRGSTTSSAVHITSPALNHRPLPPPLYPPLPRTPQACPRALPRCRCTRS